MVFARTGAMDRAVDFVRRALYCLETAFCEGFTPTSSEVKLDPMQPVNAPLYGALFRHMQMSAMLGCPGVSAEVAKVAFLGSVFRQLFLGVRVFMWCF